MAVTTTNSTQYGNTVATPPVKNAAYDAGNPRVFYFSYTAAAAADATSTVNLVTIPAGKWRLLRKQSYIVTSDFGSSSQTLDVGYTAYTNFDGTAVTADADAFCSALDVTTAATVNDFYEAQAAGGAVTYFIDSTTDVVINATVNTAAMPLGATISGYVTVVGA